MPTKPQKKVVTRFKERRRHFIKEWRKHRGLTQEQLAERIGWSPGAVSQLETGRASYTQPILEAIAEELRCSPGDLLMRDPTDHEAVWSIWDNLDQPAKNQAIRVLRTFQKTGTSH